ncbi:MAG: 5'-nucleotidase [Gammaproteobacteria bacterium]|nr:5'-nucleotidase [Gammaproteobacteria bacterium]
MPTDLSDKLVIAISSRALFDLEAGHRVFVEKGLEAYAAYQIEHEDDLLEPGMAFPLVKKLLKLNEAGPQKVEIILISHNSADTGLRIFNSISHYDLEITRAAFTNGAPPWRYIAPFSAHLFLSPEPQDVVKALDNGIAAATILPGKATEAGSDELRIAFDGDAVIFSDEAERIFKEKGLAAFADSERSAARTPLLGGPFKKFLEALHRIQSEFPVNKAPIRTALVTARSAPAHERVIRTLREWDIRIDEALFLGGMEKTEFLKAFGADIFFDDQKGHVELASDHVATGHVPHGVANTSS